MKKEIKPAFYSLIVIGVVMMIWSLVTYNLFGFGGWSMMVLLLRAIKINVDEIDELREMLKVSGRGE